MMSSKMRPGLAWAMAAGSIALAGAALAQAPQAAPAPAPLVFGWSPKKVPLTAYAAPNRPLWKLSDVLSMLAGQANWSQPIVRNKDIYADWHQMASGGKTTEVMYPDNRVGIIVWGGQLRVRIDGQAPFIASKGFE